MTRERDRYRRASPGEQLREGFLAFWRNRTARIVAAILLAGLLILRLLTPENVPLAGLAVGDCLYLRPPGPSDLDAQPRIPGAPADLLTYDRAERASCELSHSHEVTDVFSVGLPGETYPGFTALLEVNGARCDSAFRTYLGTADGASPYATALWAPNEDAWRDGGVRIAACLVFNADLSLLDHRAISGTPLTRPSEPG